MIMVVSLALHLLALAGFMQARHHERARAEPEPMMASILEAPAEPMERLPQIEPRFESVPVALLTPPTLPYEPETISVSTQSAPATPITTAQTDLPPVVESVEYVRPPAPVYPAESSRKRERGTVLLRVLVDSRGRPAQVRVEHSSGYERLDRAARNAVEKALFRPYEVNGVARPAQVLIPIEFTRRAT